MVLEKALEVVNPLDLRHLFLQEIIGFGDAGIYVFLILGTAFVAYLCAKFRMPNQVVIMMILCWLFIMGSSSNAALTIGCFAAGLLISWGMSKLIGRM